MTPKEIREKGFEELAVLQKELNEELFSLKMKNSTGQLDKTHRLKELKREIARVLTIKREKATQANQ